MGGSVEAGDKGKLSVMLVVLAELDAPVVLLFAGWSSGAAIGCMVSAVELRNCCSYANSALEICRDREERLD